MLGSVLGGLALKSPIVAASAPPTESVASIKACADAGVGAVVTKSIVDYNRLDFPDTPRRAYRTRKQFSIEGSFASETLTLAEGARLVAEARGTVDIPIIASVGVLDATSSRTIDTVATLIEAGADMIHFDLFYLPQPRATDAGMTALADLFARVRQEIDAPFGAKLNLDFPAHRVAAAFEANACDAWFALDSVRVPPPLDRKGAGAIPHLVGDLECSLFGTWQKPLALQYARVLCDAGFADLCIGGGLQNAEDIREAVMLGAGTVQVATQIMVHGYDWIRKTNEALERLVTLEGVPALQDLRGRALAIRDAAGGAAVHKVVAVVDPDVCQPCGVCTRIVFCPFIEEGANGVPRIDRDCYGCGFCEILCPRPGAIRLEPVL